MDPHIQKEMGVEPPVVENKSRKYVQKEMCLYDLLDDTYIRDIISKYLKIKK